MVRSTDTNQMCDMLNLHNSMNQEMWNHKLSIGDGNEIPVTLYDTKNSRCTSTINQLFRDMHGFIILCDINNLQSVREIPGWLQQVESRAQITDGRQVTVLVNKIESLLGLDQEESQSGLDSECNGMINMQESALDNLANILKADYPTVTMYEISIEHNH